MLNIDNDEKLCSKAKNRDFQLKTQNNSLQMNYLYLQCILLSAVTWASNALIQTLIIKVLQ